MHLHYFSKGANFGDSINPDFWQRFANFSDIKKNDELLVGIGTILDDKIPTGYKKVHVLGSGAGYNRFDSFKSLSIDFHFVRGPLTAKLLGIDESIAVTDPGILFCDYLTNLPSRRDYCGFIPHVGIDSERIKLLVEDCGLKYISPKINPIDFINEVATCQRVICSAMHGAILADSLRIPWFPVSTSNEILYFKWNDWALSLDMSLSLKKLPTIWKGKNMNAKSIFYGSIKEFIFANTIKSILKSERFYLSDTNIFNCKKNKVEDIIGDFYENNKSSSI